MNKYRFFNRLAGVALLVLISACSKEVATALPQEIGSDTACSLDGMVLADYPGPKAQVLYAEGAPDFYCDLMELFATLLAPEQKRQIAGMFVQDMGQAAWEHPSGHWIDAKTALYVVGSKKTGSMGPTFGSFANMQDAESFAKKEGGKILRFEQITLEMVNLPSSTLHDSKLH